MCAKLLQSCPALCNAMIVANQAPLSMGFPRQGHWRGLPFPSPGDLPDPGITPMSFMSLALASGFLTTSMTWEAQIGIQITTVFGKKKGEASEVQNVIKGSVMGEVLNWKMAKTQGGDFKN